MSTFRPGDRVLYRDGDRFGVAQVELVKDRHLTAFPFDVAHRRWSRRNRRIATSFVIGKLPPQEHADRIAKAIEVLRNQLEAQRQIANRQFEARVRELIAASSSAAVVRKEAPRP